MKTYILNVPNMLAKDRLVKHLLNIKKNNYIVFKISGVKTAYRFDIKCDDNAAELVDDYLIAIEDAKKNEPRKFYGYSTTNAKLKDDLRTFLKELDIYYELSGWFNGWHFEIKCSREELKSVNQWLYAY